MSKTNRPPLSLSRLVRMTLMWKFSLAYNMMCINVKSLHAPLFKASVYFSYTIHLIIKGL